MRYISLICVGLILAVGYLSIDLITARHQFRLAVASLDALNEELEHLQKEHKATVEACSEAWLKLPPTQKELDKLDNRP